MDGASQRLERRDVAAGLGSAVAGFLFAAAVVVIAQTPSIGWLLAAVAALFVAQGLLLAAFLHMVIQKRSWAMVVIVMPVMPPMLLTFGVAAWLGFGLWPAGSWFSWAVVALALAAVPFMMFAHRDQVRRLDASSI